jgi:hypothetical protein
MEWLSILTLVTALSLNALLPSVNSAFEGRVITESGSPIQGAGVVLVSKGAPEIEYGNFVNTDETGTFHLKRIPDAVFVQKEGYLPQLFRVVSVGQKPLVVMQPLSPESMPAMPLCRELGSGERFVSAGFKHRIIVGSELEIKQTNGVDNGFTEISYRKNRHEKMSISWGIGGIIGYPNIDALARTSDIVVRDAGRDISGATTDGKRWRWMFGGSAHIEYYDASPETAELFDHQIAGICTIHEVSKSVK